MGIIGHVVKPKGLRFMNEIKTYGELCEEITKTEEAIEDVINGFFYEDGDESDLQLHLIRLKRVKIKNEKKFRVEQELGIHECPECGSIKLTVTHESDITRFIDDYEVECLECGHKWASSVNRYEYRRIVDKVEEEFKDVSEYD